MDGVLLIDKPRGLTSHDVVARLRRTLGERRIGHAGTLDPMATGLLVLVVGRATRLASLLSGHDKAYLATVRLGQRTTTDDADGEPLGAEAAVPSEAAVRHALNSFEGTFPQLPPDHSAKKIGGQRAYALARASKAVHLRPVDVTVRRLAWAGFDGRDLQLEMTVTAGFYVRALARDLGQGLGCGGHLRALRRVQSGAFAVEQALSLAAAEAAEAQTADRLIPPAAALAGLDSVDVSPAGRQRVLHGSALGAEYLPDGVPNSRPEFPVRILSEGRLVALARRGAGTLHPVVVLG